MGDQEYYDYSRDDGRDSLKNDSNADQVGQNQDSQPVENPHSKKRGCLGCYIILISIVMIIAGIITFSVAWSSAPEKSQPINVQGKKIVIVEDVNPDNNYGISMQVTLAGNHYYKYTEYVNTTRNGRTVKKAVKRKSLVHRVPYTVKAIRESTGEEVFSLEDKFENGLEKKVQTQNEYLNNSPSFTKEIKKFDFTDKVRFEFVVNPDEKYSTVLEKGEVGVYQMSSSRNATRGIGFFIAVLGCLGFAIGVVGAIIEFFVLAAKEKAKQKTSAQKTDEVIEIEV